MDQENKLKCEECGKDLALDPYAHNKLESEPAHKNDLVCVNKECKKGVND